jgi:membrane-associated phospholipid phosphatase
VSRADNRLVCAAGAAAFAALAGLVAAGTASGVDQWACDHLMPFAGKPAAPPTFLESLVPLLHAGWQPAGAAIAQVVTLPGQVVVSFLLVLLGAWKLREPGWVAAWLAAVAVEEICRHALTRPALYRGGVHAVAFDASWPSGHALRCALVAAVLAAAWPRLRWALGAWLVAAVLLLLLAGAHTPTDLAGGLLLALLACGAARAGRRLRER